MFTAILCGYTALTSEDKRAVPPKPLNLTVGADILAGISILVIGILSLTAPHLGITLSSAAQWALIGAGATYIGFMLLAIVAMAKLRVPESKQKYLC